MIRLFWLILCSTLLNTSYANNTITLASTSSTDNSGLLNYLLPKFSQTHPINVKVIATGTGKALELAKRGDVDLVWVHAPKQEIDFVTQGYGIDRRYVMFNQFIMVGPDNDPANIAQAENINDVFEKIAKKKATFISRGDNSGTHSKELSFWQPDHIKPKQTWYKEVGQGMAKTLFITDELSGYTLVDQGTWLFIKDKLSLRFLYSGDKQLYNPYHIILTNPEKHPDINYQAAKQLSNWLVSAEGQKHINQYRVNGQQLFFAP